MKKCEAAKRIEHMTTPTCGNIDGKPCEYHGNLCPVATVHGISTRPGEVVCAPMAKVISLRAEVEQARQVACASFDNEVCDQMYEVIRLRSEVERLSAIVEQWRSRFRNS